MVFRQGILARIFSDESGGDRAVAPDVLARVRVEEEAKEDAKLVDSFNGKVSGGSERVQTLLSAARISVSTTSFVNDVEKEKKKKKEKDDEWLLLWLSRMSPAYQQAYRDYMSVLDDVETRNNAMKQRLSDHERILDKELATMERNAFRLPDGRIILPNGKNGYIFKDGSSVKEDTLDPKDQQALHEYYRQNVEMIPWLSTYSDTLEKLREVRELKDRSDAFTRENANDKETAREKNTDELKESGGRKNEEIRKMENDEKNLRYDDNKAMQNNSGKLAIGYSEEAESVLAAFNGLGSDKVPAVPAPVPSVDRNAAVGPKITN